jgi:hypothetical protein
MGERDDDSRVAIWTECQRMDMLLAEVRHLSIPTGYRIDHSGLGARAKKVIGNMSLFCSPLTAGHGSWLANCRNDDVTF